jgi:uncharacterized protein YhjY with autotransporter beta-barrel domain
MRKTILAIVTASATGLAAAPQPSPAANAAFQTFFFNVCPGSTGELAARCAQTPGAAGNVSGDSESSLNPSQNLSQSLAPLGLAQVRGAESRDRGERARDEGEATQVAAATIDVGPVAVLVNARGTWFERDRDPVTDQERGLDGDSRGLEIGFDRRMSDRSYVGLLLAAEKTEYDYDAELPGVNFVPASSAGDAETDEYSLTGYLTFNTSARSFLELSAGYVKQDHSFRRNSVFQETTRTVAQTDVRTEGETDGDVLWGSLNIGFDWNSGSSTFGPYAGVTYARSEIDGYVERDLNNSGLNMAFGATERTSTLGHIGLRFDHAVSTGSGVFVPQLRVEYLYEFEDDVPEATASFALDAQAAQYLFSGDEPDSGVVNAGVGATFILPGGWIWFLNYDYLANGDLDRQRATIGLRAEF